MRALFAVPVLLLALLMGCSEPQILYSERVYPALDEVAPRQLALHIVNGFTAEEEAMIIAAVVEWNRRAAVRFNVAALNYRTIEPGAWSVVKNRDVEVPEDDRRLQPAAVTRRMTAGGGAIVVDPGRLGARDLTSVMALELGVAAGSTDDPVRSAHDPGAPAIAHGVLPPKK